MAIFLCAANLSAAEHYGYDDSDPTKQFSKDKQTVWFDDVVIATRYIGPMEK